jgi:hypothetical protein
MVDLPKGWEMADYYQYLWKATWIEALGFLCLSIFVLARLIWKVHTRHKQGTGRYSLIISFFQAIAWIGVLCIYLLMLYRVEPDWFSRVQWLQGEVQGKSMTQSSLYPYTVEIQAESGSKTLVVDSLSFRELNPGQRVKMSYLPHRLEAVTCEILP